MALLSEWATRHGVSPDALRELKQMMGVETDPTSCKAAPQSEAAVQTQVRLEASRQGMRLWRNNVGACKDENGRIIRYGLCNESKQLNAKVKSSDLIGIRPVLITPDMVGQTIGQFAAYEIKKSDWCYTGTAREEAQRAFIELIVSMGGYGRFTTGEL